MIKIFEVTAELFMSADRVIKISVKANTERKAEIIAKDELKKKFNTDMVRILSVTTIV